MPAATMPVLNTQLSPYAQEWYPPGWASPADAPASTGTPPAPAPRRHEPQSTLLSAAGPPVPAAGAINPLPSPAAAAAASTTADTLELSELPQEILSCVASFMHSPQDLAHCLMVSSQLHAAVRSAPLTLALSDKPLQRLSFPSQSGSLDQLVAALTRYMPAMRACNLATLPLEHTHIAQLASGLQHLQHLDLSGCKKLRASVTRELLQHLGSRRLASLNLQRCYQLTAGCLTDLLAYTCSSSSGSSKALQCIALSHLTLSAWPAVAPNADGSEGPAKTSSSSQDGSTWRQQASDLLRRLPAALCRLPSAMHRAVMAGGGGSSGLRVLVLSNCSMLSAEGLISLAAACPQLEYIFLGGSTLQAPVKRLPGGPSSSSVAAGGEEVYVPPQAARSRSGGAVSGGGGAAAASAGPGGGAAALPDALRQLAELLQLPETLPWEQLSRCCEPASGCCRAGACDCSCGCCSRGRLAGARSGESEDGDDADGGDQRAGGGREAELHQRARKRLCRNEPSPAAVAAARAQALALAYMAGLLPGLKAVEISFMPPGVAGWLRVCLQRLQQRRRSGDSGGTSGPKVWQFACMASVADALGVLAGARSAHARHAAAATTSCAASGRDPLMGVAAGGGAAAGASASGGPLDPACLEMAVRCAANCSGRGRSTPLHAAAEVGCACHVRALAAAGAAVSARDASGATPLFVAAEAGNAAAASALLAAGADCLLGNTAGETPLYIAALRGHLGVVEVLLAALSAAGLDWTQRQLYGDAWTPLMAAAVANRVNVALCLLRAAAMACYDESAGGSSSRTALAPHTRDAPAPGRSSGSAAGTAVLRLLAAENRYGQTALHIAARKGCRELLQLLLLYGAGRVAGRAIDAAGDTPLDIAKRHGHDSTVRELLQQC